MNQDAPRGLRREEVTRLVDELSDLVVGQHVGKVFDAPDGNLRIVIGSGSTRRHLLISLHPETARMILWDDPPAATPSPGELATALRELLSASRVERVDQPGGDRVMRLVLSRGGKTGPTRELIVELFGRMGRMVVIEGGSRRVLLVSGRAGVGRGDPYALPDGARDLDPSGPTATMPFDPIQAIPSDQRGGEAPLHQWLFPRLQQQEQQNHLRTLLRVEQQSLKRALKLLRRRTRKLDQDLEAGALWQQWQRYGELLKGNIPRISRGMNSIEVQDWYQEGAPLVEIPLEKDRTPMQNIERCFRRARKGKRSLVVLGERRDQALDAISQLEQGVESIEQQQQLELLDHQSVEQCCSEARSLGSRFGKKRQQRRVTPRGSSQVADAPRFRKYRSREGLEILAGRSARENDELSIRTARGNDLFFHVAHRPGAHVILRVDRGRVAAPESIEDAAYVAAYLSGWRGPGTAIVHWTEAKNVRKPKGLPPGKVRIHREREYLVTPREDGLSSVSIPDLES